MASEEYTEAAKNAVLALLKHKDNQKCAECDGAEPTWVSINIGVFICSDCAGSHRSLGTHISKVRSPDLDNKWTKEIADFLISMGNVKANKEWEPNVKPSEKPKPSSSRAVIDDYIRRKYVRQEWRNLTPKQRYDLNLELEPKQGWVVKCGGRVKTWKKRWFVISDNGTVTYYTDKPEKGGKEKGTFSARGATVSKVEKSDEVYHMPLCFTCEVPSKARTYVCSCESEEWRTKFERWLCKVGATHADEAKAVLLRGTTIMKQDDFKSDSNILDDDED